MIFLLKKTPVWVWRRGVFYLKKVTENNILAQQKK